MSDERQFPAWEKLYQERAGETMPWYYAALDPDLDRALSAFGPRGGSALDLGTGPGTQAIALAERGFAVTATDVSAAAVEQARARAEARGLAVQFRQDDVLDSRLEGSFDFVLDRGCFHVIVPERRAAYVDAVRQLVAPGGFLFLKCFSAKQPGGLGPFRFAPEDIERIFGAAFAVRAIEETVYQGTLNPEPRALFCVLQRP
ncbi:MAG TPA: class I SAM-dependent methyltransferase [Polyangiaceae bacterium]|nr:class I SAM-dependent methyltransferase [Polyangiaceae bacterium]